MREKIRAALEKPCETCKGTGKWIEYSQKMDEGGHVTESSAETDCSQCNGTGEIGKAAEKPATASGEAT